MIINQRITEAIQMLKCFESDQAVMYWINKISLNNSEKGFILMYMGKCQVL